MSLKITASEVIQKCQDACSDSGYLPFHCDFYSLGGLTPPPTHTPFCLFKQQGRRAQLVVNGLTKLPELPPAARK